MDWSALFLAIITLVSVTTGIITTVINNHHALRIHKTTANRDFHLNVIINFLESAETAIRDFDIPLIPDTIKNSFAEYSLKRNMLYMVTSPTLWNEIDLLSSKIQNHAPDARDALAVLSKKLAKIIPKP